MVKTAREYAQERGVSSRTIRRWIAAGYLRAERKGHGKTTAWLIHDPPASRIIEKSLIHTAPGGQHPQPNLNAAPGMKADLAYTNDPEIQDLPPSEVIELTPWGTFSMRTLTPEEERQRPDW